MKLKFQQKIILNYIMVHAKENLNLVFITTRNHFKIEVTKRSFQIHWRQLKGKSENYNVRWKLSIYATLYKCGTRNCDLCQTEKYVIARANQEHLLNKRTEIISKCHHRNKYLIKKLSNVVLDLWLKRLILYSLAIILKSDSHI